MSEFGSNPNPRNELQLDFYQGNPNRNDLRSYTVNSYPQIQPNPDMIDARFPYDFDPKSKKAKAVTGSSSLSSKVWYFSDPEFKRKKRIASYRALTLEGKVKGSFRKSFKWLKHRFFHRWA